MEPTEPMRVSEMERMNVLNDSLLSNLLTPASLHPIVIVEIIKKKYEAEGDLGTVAKTSKGKQRTLGFGAKPKPLMASDVLQVFREIAKTAGAKSQNQKVDKIKKLLVRAQGPEAKYIIRGLQGKLRIGLAQSTVAVSLAHAVTLTPPQGINTDGNVPGTYHLSLFCCCRVACCRRPNSLSSH